MQDDDTAASLAGRYTIEPLAPGSYDLLLDGRLVGGIVRDTFMSGRLGEWRVELLDDEDGGHRPARFTASEQPVHGVGRGSVVARSLAHGGKGLSITPVSCDGSADVAPAGGARH